MSDDETKRLATAIDTLTDRIVELTAVVERHIGECEGNWERVAEHHEVLFGNGKPGLAYDVQVLKTVAGIRAKVTWAIVGVISGGLTTGIGLLANWYFGG